MSRSFMVGPDDSRFEYPGPPNPNRIVRHLVRAEDSEDRFAVVAYQVGYDIPRHVHELEDESIYLLEGEITVQIGEETHHLTPGSFVFMPRHVPHSITIVNGPWQGISVSAPAVFDKMEADVAEAVAAAADRGETLSPETVAEIRARYGLRMLPAEEA